jgi:hypothetical protein
MFFNINLLTDSLNLRTFAHPNENHQKSSINNHDYSFQSRRPIRQTRVVQGCELEIYER